MEISHLNITCSCQVRYGGGWYLLHCPGEAEGEGVEDVQRSSPQQSDRGSRGRGGQAQQQVQGERQHRGGDRGPVLPCVRGVAEQTCWSVSLIIIN